MPYTLAKGLVWVLLAVLLGIVVGWLLRSVAAKRQVERARAANVGTADQQELERLRNRIASLEPVVGERDRLQAELADERLRSSIPQAVPDTATHDDAGSRTVPDLGARADDLTVIVGVGPNIAELCHGIGITTWAELAATEVSLLRTMLTDAGQRFKAHDPSTWPQQAALLASGSWTEFQALADTLEGERPAG